ncbi:phosphatase yihX [Penicillium samsonianum]|uniref:phosphatase yihX n=1 Tax=Penicillium samsonianum TaxID=1882272 RepID=UPI002548D02E|nr:phosphatase yihX [Penicillium samsonianum]KAJ6131841.1 phosphatase yihX [Penicillium samsonianum]
MPPYKAVIFDMGDVLFRWNPKADTQVSVQMLRSITKCDLWNEFERGNIDTKECYQQLGEMFSICPSEIAATFSQTTGSLTPNDEMTVLLQDLKRQTNISIYMMTNIPRPDFYQLRATEYVWDCFDGIFASGFEGMRKPDLCFYQHVLEKIGILAVEAIFVDDKGENVSAARELGMEAIQCVNVGETCNNLRAMIHAKMASPL